MGNTTAVILGSLVGSLSVLIAAFLLLRSTPSRLEAVLGSLFAGTGIIFPAIIAILFNRGELSLILPLVLLMAMIVVAIVRAARGPVGQSLPDHHVERILTLEERDLELARSLQEKAGRTNVAPSITPSLPSTPTAEAQETAQPEPRTSGSDTPPPAA